MFPVRRAEVRPVGLSGRAVHTRNNILVVLQEIESVVVQQHRGNIGRAS